MEMSWRKRFWCWLFGHILLGYPWDGTPQPDEPDDYLERTECLNGCGYSEIRHRGGGE